MTRSFRIQGFLAGLCLAAGALALPLSAEEITVTVPPDDHPAAVAKPAAPLPSFTGSGLAQSDTGAAAQGGTAPAATTAKHKDKKAAAAKAKPSASDTTTGSTTPTDATGAAGGDAAAKPKTASKASPCKDADEPTCGSNKLCKWVEGTTDAAGKATKSRCRSLAALKKEAAKKTAKAGEGDALPWAAKTESPTGDSGAAASTGTSAAGTDGTAKPAKKTKTASAKKPAKPKTETPAVQPSAPPAGDGSAGPPPEAPSNADPQ